MTMGLMALSAGKQLAVSQLDSTHTYAELTCMLQPTDIVVS